MTRDKFAELVIEIWRLRALHRKATADLLKRGMVLKRRGGLCANPNVRQLALVNGALRAAAAELIGDG